MTGLGVSPKTSFLKASMRVCMNESWFRLVVMMPVRDKISNVVVVLGPLQIAIANLINVKAVGHENT